MKSRKRTKWHIIIKCHIYNTIRVTHIIIFFEVRRPVTSPIIMTSQLFEHNIHDFPEWRAEKKETHSSAIKFVNTYRNASFIRIKLVYQVNFENCWLNYVDPTAFRGLTRLVEINFVNNELQTLHPDMEDSLSATGLRVLRLYRNPWTCNCRLRWLRRWITSGSATGSGSSIDYSASSAHFAGGADHSSSGNSVNWDFASNTPTCAAPRLLRTVAWRHLTPDQFACPSRIVGLSSGVSTQTGHQSASLSPLLSSPPSVAAGAAAEIKAFSGHNATIECLAAGDPEPTILWSRDPDVPLTPGLSVMVQHRGGEDAAGVGGEPVVVGILTLVMVNDERDTGDYRCTADNPAGRAEVSFRLTIVDAGLPIIPKGRVSGTGNEGGGGGGGSIRRTIATSDKEVNDANWTDVDRDVILGIIGGLLVLAGILALFVACRPKLGDCIRRQRDHSQRHRHDNKSAAYRNDCAASKPLNNVTSIAMTSLSPTSTLANNANRRNHRGYNRTDSSVVLGVDTQRNGMEMRLFEPEEDDDDVDEEDDGGQYDSASCKEPLTRRSDVSHSSSSTGTTTNSEHCSKQTLSGGSTRSSGQRTLCNDVVDLVRIGNNDAGGDVGVESSSTSLKSRPPAEVGNSCFGDDVSLSDQLSEVSGDRLLQSGDPADLPKTTTVDVTAGDVCGRHERSNRTVSFGPDLVLDADNSAMSKWSKQIDDEDADGCNVRVHRRPNFVGAIATPPVSALKLGRPDKNSEIGSAATSPVSLGETPSISTSSSSHSTRSTSNPGHIADVIDRRPVTTNSHVGEARVLPVGRPCVMWPKSEDPRLQPLAAGHPPSNRRHSGCNIDQQVRPVNGFAFSHQLGPAPASVHRLHPVTCGGSQLLAACSSLERPSVRRRLPQPRTFAVDDRRDSYRNANCDATSTLPSRHSGIGCGAASYLAPGRHICTSSSNYSTCLPNPNESASATASYTLADILAPPFGAIPVHTGARKSAGFGNDRTETNRKYTISADIDDDESITTIL